MNPALLQNSYSNSYPLTNEVKYSSHDRPYPNTTVVPNEYFDRRDVLANGTIDQSMRPRVSNNGLEYEGNHPLQNQPYPSNNSQYLLTPPQSVFDPPAVSNSSASNFNFSTLPKSTSSNASNLHWNADTPSWQPNFTNMMPDVRQMPAPQMAHLSPPNIHSQFPLSRGPHMDPIYRPAYFTGDTYTSSLMSRNMPLPVPSGYTNSTFSPIPPATSLRSEGPPFEPTVVLHSVLNSRNIQLTPDIIANIGKGFFTVDDKWTCYRRNYFQVSCGFVFKSPVVDSQLFLQRNNTSSHGEQIIQWAMSISAKTSPANNCESEPRGLVQHTPKRDKATESVPTRHLVVPSPTPTLGVGHGLPHGFYANTSHMNSCLPGNLDAFGHPNSSAPPSQYTFERIQFQKATANNGKRRAQQQYFHIVVSLEANVGRHNGPPDWIVVATRQSDPMVVRGRSPGHYKDNPSTGQTSTDSDDSQGHMGHGGHSNFNLPHLGSNHATGMSWSPAAVRDGPHYGAPYGQRLDAGDYCSLSPDSSSSLASSPEKDECYGMVRGSSNRPGRSENNFDRILLSPISNRQANEPMDYSQTRKRSYEGGGLNGMRPFYPHVQEQAYQSPSFDFSATATSQGLCASS